MKYLGPIHEVLRPLRAALLQFLDINHEKLEKWPYWDFEKAKVLWHEELIVSNPSELEVLKGDPLVAFEKYFKNTVYDTFPEQINISNTIWKNHLFTLKVMVCDLCAIV